MPDQDATQGVTRREALGTAMVTATALGLGGADPALANPVRAGAPSGAGLGSGGTPMSLAQVAAVAKRIGGGEPVAIVDLAAVDMNCARLLAWSKRSGVAWRPAYKTLRSAQLLEYVLAKLDRPKVMIHHLRDLPQALPRVPAGTDFLMGYPPTVGELREYLRSRPPRGERPYRLRINVDGLPLLRALDQFSRTSPRKRPIDVCLEIYNGIPRGGIHPGSELTEALRILRSARGRLRLSALLCYDALASGVSDPTTRKDAATFAQKNLTAATKAIADRAKDFVDVAALARNGPGSSNYTNWTQSTAANEFSAGSAVLFANYLDPYDHVAGLRKAFFMCAPVLRLPENDFFGQPFPVPEGTIPVYVKSGGWPTGNNPTLSKLVFPEGLGEGPVYGRGSNASGLLVARPGQLALGDYVVETPQQVMEGQDFFGAIHPVREGKVVARWPVLSRWGGER